MGSAMTCTACMMRLAHGAFAAQTYVYQLDVCDDHKAV